MFTMATPGQQEDPGTVKIKELHAKYPGIGKDACVLMYSVVYTLGRFGLTNPDISHDEMDRAFLNLLPVIIDMYYHADGEPRSSTIQLPEKK